MDPETSLAPLGGMSSAVRAFMPRLLSAFELPLRSCYDSGIHWWRSPLGYGGSWQLLPVSLSDAICQKYSTDCALQEIRNIEAPCHDVARCGEGVCAAGACARTQRNSHRRSHRQELRAKGGSSTLVSHNRLNSQRLDVTELRPIAAPPRTACARACLSLHGYGQHGDIGVCASVCVCFNVIIVARVQKICHVCANPWI